MPDSLMRRRFVLAGRVQGIGFRWTAERMALSLRLTGWVKNLEDGRVEVVAEGSQVSLKEFLRKLNGVFKKYIKDADVNWSEATGEFNAFDIRF